jgi:hypothetical protein
MSILPLIVQMLSLVCLVAASMNFWSNKKIQWGWMGIALWLFSLMISTTALHQAI